MTARPPSSNLRTGLMVFWLDATLPFESSKIKLLNQVAILKAVESAPV